VAQEEDDATTELIQSTSTIPSFREGMKVGVLLRISNKEKIDDGKGGVAYSVAPKLENQAGALQGVVNEYKLNVVKMYKEVHRARKAGEKHRKVLREILGDAENKLFEALLVWAPDRITREGGWEMVGYIKRFNSYGVVVYSHLRGWLDISEPMKEWMVYNYGMLARVESDMNSVRTLRSRERRIAVAKAAGVAPKLGGWTPVALTPDQLERLKHMRSLGYSIEACADVLAKENPKITGSVIKRVLKEGE
jgi:DNA invertase Pin-like site-specific DNA recombinase